MITGGIGLTAVLLVAGAFGIVRSSGKDGPQRPVTGAAIAAVPAALTGRGATPGASLDQMIATLQDRLAATPGDDVSWATLGLAYVQQARVTIDPSYYPRAQGALQQSLDIEQNQNFLAHAGLSALAAARHDFATAKQQAMAGLAINPYSAILYGALSDAETQLGQYDAAFAAVQKMIDLKPDTSSLSRASYTWELRGDVTRARDLMQRALDDAPTPADRAFALYQLGDLAFNAGDPSGALELYRQALVALPENPAASAGKARAEAALGQYETAIDDYAALVQRAPDPTYLLEYGELLESLGRSAEANEQYQLFEVTQRLFAGNGVQPDAILTLYQADHGDPAAALTAADAGIAANPFVTMRDAYAWALHRNGRDTEALVQVDEAIALGLPNARFHFHAGSIALALGDDARAKAEFETALSINPYFNPIEADIARAALVGLGGSA